MSPEWAIRKARRLYTDTDMSVRDIAQEIEVSDRTVYRWVVDLPPRIKRVEGEDFDREVNIILSMRPSKTWQEIGAAVGRSKAGVFAFVKNNRKRRPELAKTILKKDKAWWVQKGQPHPRCMLP